MARPVQAMAWLSRAPIRPRGHESPDRSSLGGTRLTYVEEVGLCGSLDG